jgi:hypothetical protein
MEAQVEDFSNLVRQVSIDKLQEESKKLGAGFKNPAVLQNGRNPNDALC